MTVVIKDLIIQAYKNLARLDQKIKVEIKGIFLLGLRKAEFFWVVSRVLDVR